MDPLGNLGSITGGVIARADATGARTIRIEPAYAAASWADEVRSTIERESIGAAEAVARHIIHDEFEHFKADFLESLRMVMNEQNLTPESLEAFISEYKIKE